MVSERKRPWVLVLALLGALALGTSGISAGWSRMALYRDTIDPSFAAEGIADPAEHQAIVEQTRAWLDALDKAKARGWPLGVATLVLGAAVFVFAVRTLGGSRQARIGLVQLIVAQAALHVADYWLLRDVWSLNARLAWAIPAAIAHERGESIDEAPPVLPILFAIETLGSALVVVGLTRPRSREFLEARPEALGGP
jgi:hypothetical protein